MDNLITLTEWYKLFFIFFIYFYIQSGFYNSLTSPPDQGVTGVFKTIDFVTTWSLHFDKNLLFVDFPVVLLDIVQQIEVISEDCVDLISDVLQVACLLRVWQIVGSCPLRSNQNYRIGICYFCAKHAAPRSKSRLVSSESRLIGSYTSPIEDLGFLPRV